MSIKYRYICPIEGVVTVVRDKDIGPPTHCVNDGSQIEPGSLIVIQRPTTFKDAIFDGGEVDFKSSTLSGMGNSALNGTVDLHLNDQDLHRKINDNGIAATDLWSASKIISHTTGFQSHIDNAALHREINDVGTGTTDLWSAAKIINVTDPMNNHINSANIHRTINDNGTGSTDLWSASKILSYTQTLFLKEYQYVINTTRNRTTSTNYIHKMRLTTNSLSGGNYRLSCYYEWASLRADLLSYYRIVLNSTSTIAEFNVRGISEAIYTNNVFYIIPLSSGTHTIDLEYRTQTNNTTLIGNTIIELWKVSD